MDSTSNLPLNQGLWNKAVDGFKKLYGGRAPSSPKDWARVAFIYEKSGGKFRNQESIIPFSIKESINEEGVLDTVKNALSKIFTNPITLGIALLFLSKLIKKQ